MSQPSRLFAAVAAVVAVTVMSACSWRLETPAPEWPSPSPATVLRDNAADREQAVLDAIDAARDSDTADVVLAQIEPAAVAERLDVLGGVYVAYPSASPSPSAAPIESSVAVAVASARDGHVADALVTHDANLAFILASAGLSQALSAWYATWVADAVGDATMPVVAERRLDSAALAFGDGDMPGLVPAATIVAPEMLAELAVQHDQARWFYDVMAAKSPEDDRADLLARRDIHAARAEALVGLPGVADRREVLYALDTAEVRGDDARLHATQAVETSLGDTYAALMDGADRADLPWMLNAAFDAYAQAAAYGEPTSQSYAVPALPGLTTDVN